MKTNPHSKNELLKLCGEIGLEDGIDPREFFRYKDRKESHRKTYQLCHQVAETLNIELASRSEPPFSELGVVRVEPAPDSSHLRVVVEPLSPGCVLVEAEVIAALYGVRGHFRNEVAAAITRRRVPELSFLLQPYGSEEE